MIKVTRYEEQEFALDCKMALSRYFENAYQNSPDECVVYEVDLGDERSEGFIGVYVCTDLDDGMCWIVRRFQSNHGEQIISHKFDLVTSTSASQFGAYLAKEYEALTANGGTLAW